MSEAIDNAIPEAGKSDEVKLLAIDANELAGYVIQTGRPWWRRRLCVAALRGRVPETRVVGLLNRIRDPEETSEIRIALLDVLGDRSELLPWLQAQGESDALGLYEATLKARGVLGDLTAAPQLSTLANMLRGRQREIGEAALDLLVERHGAAAVEAAIGHERPEDRVFANRMRSRAGADLSAAFADPDVGVARGACDLVISSGIPDDEMLLDHVVTGPTTDSRLWAAYALHRRGRDIRELWHAIDSPRVELPELPADVRAAIVRHYPGETRTDPRWLVEQACVDAPPPPDEEAQLARAVAALDAAALAPRAPRPIGEVNQQGEGTYHVIELGDGSAVSVSNLGAFAGGEDDNPRARAALEGAGFRWIDDELGKLVIPGLPVYYFRYRDALDLWTLLFYWQD